MIKAQNSSTFSGALLSEIIKFIVFTNVEYVLIFFSLFLFVLLCINYFLYFSYCNENLLPYTKAVIAAYFGDCCFRLDRQTQCSDLFFRSASDCNFDNNGTVADIKYYNSPFFANCTFTNNKGDYVIGGENTVEFYSCLFEKNTAAATFKLYGAYLEGCTILDNVSLFKNYTHPSPNKAIPSLNSDTSDKKYQYCK